MGNPSQDSENIPNTRFSCRNGTLWLGSGTVGSEMTNLVSLSRVQESVTVQTLECCSCLGAQLKYTNWEGWRSTEGFGLYNPWGWELHALDLS